MKRLLLPLLSALALPTAVNANWFLEKTLGIYASKFEARDACYKWIRNGGYGSSFWDCKWEEETKQYLLINEYVEKSGYRKRELLKKFKY